MPQMIRVKSKETGKILSRDGRLSIGCSGRGSGGPPGVRRNTTVKPLSVKKMIGVHLRAIYSRWGGQVGNQRCWIFRRLIFSFSVVGFSPRRAAALRWMPFTLFRVSTMISLSIRSMVS